MAQRTILAIAQEAAERDNSAPAPTSLFASATKVAKLLRVAAKDTVRDYLTRSGHTGMSEFQSTWVFGLQPGRFAYPLPPDFLRMIPNTEHRGGWPLGLIGPASPQAWAAWIFGGAVTAVEMGWRIRNNAIFFEPVPRAAELVAIEYISRFPVVSRIREGDFDFSVSPPQALAPWVPRDGYQALNGLDITVSPPGEMEFDGGPGWDIGVWGQEVWEVLRQISPTSAIAPYPEVRRPEFEHDEDRPVFEDDHLLSLGMTYRLRRGLGLDYAEAAAEYEIEMEQKLAHDAGGARGFRLGQDRPDYDTYPVGNGKWLVT
jgi:hypothetical protein